MKVAVVGSGQLARMMALSAWPMGIQFSYLVQQGDSLDPITSLGEVIYDEEVPEAEGDVGRGGCHVGLRVGGP